MGIKKISEFEENTTPKLSDLIPIVNNGVTKKISLSGISETIGSQHWFENSNREFTSSEVLVIPNNLVLINSNISLISEDIDINLGELFFNKSAQFNIGGYLLLVDSNIVNNGLISVGGAIILSGDSTITGTGIIL